MRHNSDFQDNDLALFTFYSPLSSLVLSNTLPAIPILDINHGLPDISSLQQLHSGTGYVPQLFSLLKPILTTIILIVLVMSFSCLIMPGMMARKM